jgi:hypothetical protein
MCTFEPFQPVAKCINIGSYFITSQINIFTEHFIHANNELSLLGKRSLDDSWPEALKK